MPLQKDVLFYSNYCLFSKKLLTTIHKLNIKHFFTTICVEAYKSSIPKVVDRVPLILSTNGDVIVEDVINDYIETIAHKLASRGSDGETLAPQDIFSHTDAGFSYIDDPIEGNATSYGIFGEEQHIETPEDDEGNGDDHAKNYERYKASRDAELPMIPKPT